MLPNHLKKICVVGELIVLLICTAVYGLSITHGPYLYDLTENEVTIIWLTDEPCYASVEYGTGGSFTNKEEAVKHGVLIVGTLHKVRIKGLKPGLEYNYRVNSIEVKNYTPLFPTIGNTINSSDNTFITFNKRKTNYTFYVVTDIHNSTSRMNTLLDRADWTKADFLVMTGDVVDDLSKKDSARIYSVVVDPCVKRFAGSKPFLYLRGNHEYRGSLGPHLYKFFPNTTGRWHYTFYHGPAFFFIIDTGEDKADNSSPLGGIIRCEPYKIKQKIWFENYVNENTSLLADFPVKIGLAHDPNWGYNTNYDAIANSAGLSLLIAGHTHSYNHKSPGNGKNFHTLVVGQGQLARISLSATQSETVGDVVVYNSNGNEVDSWQFKADGTGILPDQLTNTHSFKNISKTYKSHNGLIVLPEKVNGMKKLVAVYDLRGRLLIKTATRDQIIRVNALLSQQGVAKSVSIVKVITTQ